jgi:CRISPR-associated exonuclease Cas4
VHAFSDLALAVYCPRKRCYRREDARAVPDAVEVRRALAFEYRTLLDADASLLRTRPIALEPDEFRTNLARTRDRLDRFEELADPPERDVLLTGRECRGIAHKLLEGPPVPSIISAGSPPENGVWEPQSVRAVAAAKALAWERQRPVEAAFVEYPAHGVVRRVELTTRRKATYRRAVRTLEAIDGPPPRLADDAKCSSCEYRDRCGVRTRSLRSLLGL